MPARDRASEVPGSADHAQPPRAVLFAIGAVLVAGVVAMFGWAQRLDDRVFGVPHPARQGPLTTVAQVLDEPATGALEGRPVRLHEARVQTGGDRVIWVGSSERRSVPVVMDGQLGEELAPREGDAVSIWGTVRSMSDDLPAFVDGGLDPAEQRRLAAQPVFVEARRVIVPEARRAAPTTPAPRTPGPSAAAGGPERPRATCRPRVRAPG